MKRSVFESEKTLYSVNSVLLFLSRSSQSIHKVHKIKIFKTLRFSKLCFYAIYFVKTCKLFSNNFYSESRYITKNGYSIFKEYFPYKMAKSQKNY